MSAIACMSAMSWRASIHRISKLQVESADAELAAATSNLAQAAADLERYTTLRGAVMRRSRISSARRRPSDEAEGRLERARRSLDLARNQHGYADLRADAEGVITATLAEPGQVVAVGQAVARLAHQGEKEAVVALPGDLARRGPQVGRGRALVVGSRPRLRRQAARARRRRTKRRAPMRLASPLTQADDTVAFGMTATVTLTPATEYEGRESCHSRQFSTAAPAHRSMSSTQPARCSAAGDGRVIRTRTRRIVTSGLDEGDKVVTLGVQKLEAGLKVRTVEIQ